VNGPFNCLDITRWDARWWFLRDARRVGSDVEYRWRGAIADDEMVELAESCGGHCAKGWWDQISPHSLGWVTARSSDGMLVGFVNVAWDGGHHAFLIDTKTRGNWQHQGVGTEVVALAAQHAEAAGCEWLNVDFAADLTRFYPAGAQRRR
jgi:GNAT superfamily N-acetyltransferase